MRKHVCTQFIEGLTVGATYTEIVKASGFVLACVINDEGQYQDVNRKYFK